MGGGPEGLHVVHRAAVADEGDAGAVGDPHVDADGPRDREPDPAAREPEVALRVAERVLPVEGVGGRQPLVDEHRVRGKRIDEMAHRRRGGDRVLRLRLVRRRAQARALRSPVPVRQRGNPGLRRAPPGLVPAALEKREEGAQGLPHVRPDRGLGRVVLAQLPVAEPDLHHRQPVRQRLDLAPHRHPEHVRPQEHRKVVGRERLAHLLLDAGEGAEEGGMLGGEVRAVGHGLLVDGGAQHLGEAGRFGEGVARRHLVPAHDDRALGAEQPLGEPGQGLVTRPAGRVHPGGGAEVDGGRPVEDVAWEREEHRPRWRGERHLGRAADDTRQVLEPVHLDRPLDERLGDGDERVVEEGLGEAVPDLLLPRRHQHRRPPELRVVERSHRVAEPRCDVHVAGREPAARPRVAVRHCDHDPFLEAEHVAHVRLVAQGVHDG